MHWKNDLTAPVPLPNLRSSFFTNLGSHLWHPQPPPVTCWPRLCCGSERERECFVCASNLWFEMWLWKANLAKYLLPLPLPASWPASFGFIFSLAFVSLDISLLPLSDYFFFIFYFFLCCPFADKHIRVLLFLLFFVFCCALYLFHFYLFALWGCWFVGYVDDAVLFVKHAKRCSDSRTRAWAGQPQSGWSSLKL